MKSWSARNIFDLLQSLPDPRPKGHRGVETKRFVPGSQLLRIHKQIRRRAQSRYPDATGKAA